MSPSSKAKTAGLDLNFRSAMRVAWTLLSIFLVESLVFGLSVLPAALFWQSSFGWHLPTEWIRIVVLSMSFLPAYLIFAFSLMLLSALSTRITGWRTPANIETSLAALEWPLLHWVRYEISIHFVHLFAGRLFRASPVWTLYLRMNGARLGTGVRVNSLNVSDHNLLDFGDDVVIGGDVHLSGHTVERGKLRTAPVRLGSKVTVGVGAVVGIGVEAGRGCQIGALAFVPKYSRLKEGTVYVGVPARRLERKDLENAAC